MAYPKAFTEMNKKLDQILARLGDEDEAAPAPPSITKEQLKDIKGVGDETADKILRLFYGDEGEASQETKD